MNPSLRKVILALLAAPLAAQDAARRPRPLDQAATESLVKAYTGESAWAMKAIVMLSLGDDWHPAGATMLLMALQDKDPHLRAFALETLKRTDNQPLSKVATAPLVTELIERQLVHKNQLVRTRTLEVLQDMLPAAGAKDAKGFQTWWAQNKATHAPAAWEPPPAQKSSNITVAGSLVERAFDLRNSGLELAIIMDSTGSMQLAIDAARDAINDVVSLLAGITPKLKLGLVHYKDLGDMKDGADMLVPLTKDEKKVREKLGRLIAGGGGDVPEKVIGGIEVALRKEMGWNKDANRLLLIVGDAPPHAADQKALLELVQRAHDAPFANCKGGPVTGAKAKDKLRPFITSTVATHPQAKVWFDEIAKAGGGASVLLDLRPDNERGRQPGAPEPPAAQLIRHVLLLAFGAQYAAQATVFVDTFFDFREAKLF